MQPLVWNNHGEWINIVKLIVKKIWGSKFVDEIENNDIYPFIANDNWISKLIESEKIKSTPFLDFSKEIANHWSHVRVYHACRTHSAETYYLSGIIKPSIQKLDQQVNEILKKYVTKDEIELLLKYMHMFYNKSDEKIFVAFDKKHLCEYCWHHLLYGSEYILCCAILLCVFTEKQKDILNYIADLGGIPTIFSCDVPIKNIPTDILYETGAILLSEAYKMFKDSTHIPFSRRLNFGIFSINSDWIVGHESVQDEKSNKYYPPVWIDVAKFERYVNSIKQKKSNLFTT